LLFPTAAAARAVARGTLVYRVCSRCGFAFNAAFDPARLDYGPAYENCQDHSPAFAAHLDGLIDRLTTRHGVRDGRVVEVGCGKGVFLQRLLAQPGNRCEAVGFDPSYTGPEVALSGRLRFVKAYYGPATAAPADVVICRHVIEHVADPLALLRAIRGGIGPAGRAKVFVETPCVEWIFRRRVPWDLFYEHCSLFTANNLGLALTRAGFAVTTIRHVFGGQYLWAEAVTGEADWPEVRVETPAQARRFAADERRRAARWDDLLTGLESPVAVWGAGAKGATFCNLADPDARRVTAVVDVNPAKQGRFLAGTGHPIVSPAEAVRRGVAAVLVLNPNYLAEVAAALADLGSPAAVIDLMEWEDARAAHH
jgi:SAM-dependent methyltransferase